MKSKIAFLVLATCICVYGLSLDDTTVAQHKLDQLNAAPTLNAQDAGTVGRFQIAAFTTEKDGSGAGYYVIDSRTGEIWMNYGDNKPKKVSEPLR